MKLTEMLQNLLEKLQWNYLADKVSNTIAASNSKALVHSRYDWEALWDTSGSMFRK